MGLRWLVYKYSLEKIYFNVKWIDLNIVLLSPIPPPNPLASVLKVSFTKSPLTSSLLPYLVTYHTAPTGLWDFYCELYTRLHCSAMYCTALHCTAVYCPSLHCTALHCPSLHCTTPHSMHCTASHCTALLFTELRVITTFLLGLSHNPF